VVRFGEERSMELLSGILMRLNYNLHHVHEPLILGENPLTLMAVQDFFTERGGQK